MMNKHELILSQTLEPRKQQSYWQHIEVIITSIGVIHGSEQHLRCYTMLPAASPLLTTFHRLGLRKLSTFCYILLPGISSIPATFSSCLIIVLPRFQHFFIILVVRLLYSLPSDIS